MNNTFIYYFLLIIFLGSCANNSTDHPPFIPLTEIKEDTAKPIIKTDFKSLAYPEIFEAAFSNSTRVKEGETEFILLKQNIGNIKSKSGKIIACDPIVMRDALPFNQLFPVGDFEVDLALAKTSNDHRVAFSRILFSKNSITKWEFALQVGQKPISLTDTSVYCYGVDAGMGLFIDSVSNKLFDHTTQSMWDKAFMSNENQTGYIYQFGEYNLATFSTGYGDGCYSTFIGRDSIGNPCQLLTDFGLIAWWKVPQK